MNTYEVLNANTFFELADNLELFLTKPDLSQGDMKKLFQEVQQSCERIAMSSFLEGHPSWSVCSGTQASKVYLYRSWGKVRNLKQNIERLSFIINEIRNDFIPAEGPQITEASATKLLSFLDQYYDFSSNTLSGNHMFALLPDCGHRVFDAFCRPYTNADHFSFCDIFMPRAVKDIKTPPECIFLHELGHVLNVRLTGDIEVPSASFQKFNELILSPEDCQAVMQEAAEMYAHVFAMAVLTATELKEFDRYAYVPDETRSLMKKYIQYELSSCNSCQQ